MTFKIGNPGRPKGSRNKKLQLFRSSDEQLQRKVLEMALSGDLGAMKIIADRLWPRLRTEAAFISIDSKSDNLAEQGRQVIDAGLCGEITVDVLRDLLTALYGQAKIVELAEFEDRLKVLEQHRVLPPWDQKVYRPVKLLTDQKLPMRGKRRRLTK